MERVDIAIIGAGMAGASLAAELGVGASVLVLEAEERPGYHTTGRSAAFWSATYGGPKIQPLTSASFAWLESHGFLHQRGALTIAHQDHPDLIADMQAEFAESGVELRAVDREAMFALVPDLAEKWGHGLLEPGCSDIDVAAVHDFYLRQARHNAVEIRSSARLESVERIAGGWLLQTAKGPVQCRILVNAAGAWADSVSAMAGASAIPITPYRRTMVQLLVDPPASFDLPVVLDAKERFYFRPEPGGRIWLSPHDEVPDVPHDVAPEERDIALALFRLEQVMGWKIAKVEHSWAGLRSFTPDRLPVYGYDPLQPDFFWFAGQGGFGIQTAPAAAKMGAALLMDKPLPDGVAHIAVENYAPDRFLR